MACSRLGPRPHVLLAVPSDELAGRPPPSLPPGSQSEAQKTVSKFFHRPYKTSQLLTPSIIGKCIRGGQTDYPDDRWGKHLAFLTNLLSFSCKSPLQYGVQTIVWMSL